LPTLNAIAPDDAMIMIMMMLDFRIAPAPRPNPNHEGLPFHPVSFCDRLSSRQG
jgi:hypothetical protein